MKTRSFFLCTLASCFFGYAVTPISAQAASPTIDLITSFNIPEPYVDTDAFSINDAKTIVGSSDFGDGNVQGFVRYRNGDYSVIINPNEAKRYTVASAINNSGLIAGYYFPGHHIRGFFLSNDTYTDFRVPGACTTYITALNDADDFAGLAYFHQSDNGCNDLKSFVSIGGNITIFTVIGAGVDFTQAEGMNNLGQVVGFYGDRNGVHGFLRDADGTLTFPIDYPGAVATALIGINDKGWMTGYYDDTKGVFHALFLQSPTEFVVFDVIPSRATYFGGINNRDFICGTYSSGPLLAHGFIARVRRSSGD